MFSLDEQHFLEQFRFQKAGQGLVGVEREFFLVDEEGMPVPKAPDVLKILGSDGGSDWTHELSACQIEHRTNPHDLTPQGLSCLNNDLFRGLIQGVAAAEKFGIKLDARGVASEKMPLDVYPDPRYLKISKTLPPDVLLAACRVAGVHIHLGQGSLEEAIRVYNTLVQNFDYLISIGNLGQDNCPCCLDLYKEMAKKWRPEPIFSVAHFIEIAKRDGFFSDPRRCWSLVRISVHGTVEVRVFDSVTKTDNIIGWVLSLRELVNRCR